MIENRRDRPVLVGSTAQPGGNGSRLVRPRYQQQDGPGRADRRDAHGQAMRRHIRFVGIESLLRLLRRGGENDLTGRCLPVAAWLVERHMAIGSKPENGEIQSASRSDGLIETAAFSSDIPGIALQQPYLIRSNSEWMETVPPQERRITVFISELLSDKFIKIQEAGLLARKFPTFLHFDKLPVETEWCVTRRQSECCRRLTGQQRTDMIGRLFSKSGRVVEPSQLQDVT